jgi:NADPH:quinone reductase-like Zn-dependent oxidoreductase
MKQMTELVEAGKVKPVLDAQKFELTTKSVHDMIQVSMTHRAKGKLVLIVSS